MPNPAVRAREVAVIETERLRLRRHRLDDLTACAAMWADPGVTRYIGGRPFSEEESWARLLRYAGHWLLLGFGYWMIEEKATGCFAGEAGLAEFRRDMEPSIQGIPELGWAFRPKFWGKGYATETVRAIVAWGDSNLESARTACLIHPDNAASIHVADKCGFLEYGRTIYKGQPAILFSRTRP